MSIAVEIERLAKAHRRLLFCAAERLERRDLLTAVVALEPSTHAIASQDANVVIGFDEAIELIDTESASIRLFAAQSATPPSSISIDGNDVTLTPSQPFRAGDVISASLTENVHGVADQSVAEPTSWQFRVGAESGLGVFAPSTLDSVVAQGIPNDMTLADIDADGDLDAIVSSDVSSHFYRNQGDNEWSRDVTMGSIPGVVEVGDVDGDGDLDLISTNGRLTLRRNNGTEFLASERIQPTLKQAVDLTLSDFDNDGDLDIVTVGPEVRLLLNDGTGSFSLSTLITKHDESVYRPRVVAGDLNNDGYSDLFIADGRPDYDYFPYRSHGGSGNTNDPIPAVWLNDGTGEFVKGQELSAPGQVQLGDYDLDGDLDLLLAGFSDGYSYSPVRYLENDGDAVFSEVDIEPNHDYPMLQGNVSFADIDVDPELELISGNGLLLDTTAEGPVLDSIHPNLQHQFDAVAAGDVDMDGDVDLFTVHHRYANNGIQFLPVLWTNIDLDTDVSVSINGGESQIAAGIGHDLEWEVVLSNDGELDIEGAMLSVPLPAQLENMAWRCLDESVCNSSGTDSVFLDLDIPAHGTLAIGITGSVSADSAGSLELSANVSLPGGQVDRHPENNSVVQLTRLVDLLISPTPQSIIPASGGQFVLSSELDWDASTATLETVHIRGSQTGAALHDAFSIVVSDGVVTILPKREFFPGESVVVTVSGISVEGESVTRAWPFHVAVDPGTGAYGVPTRLPVQNSRDARLGDMDGDGDLDVVVTKDSESQLYLNQGDGEFELSPHRIRAMNQDHVELADLDLDGDMDIIMSSYANSVTLLNEGDEGFRRSGALRRLSGNFVVGDIDSDGDPDVIGRRSDGSTYAWKNSGSNEFTEQLIGSELYFEWGDLQDLDGDGDLDLIVVHSGLTEIRLNDGAGKFSDKPKFLSQHASFADLDNDGDLDAFTATGEVWKNDGNGNFDGNIDLGDGYASPARFVDMDGDGDFDAIRDSLWVNTDGVLTMDDALRYSLWRGQPGDLDHDGNIDILVPMYDGLRIYWQADYDTDVAVTLTNGQVGFVAGDDTRTEYTVEVTNKGSAEVADIAITVELDDALTNPQWSCLASEGATCPSSGEGLLLDQISLGAESTVTYTLAADLTAESGDRIHATAKLELNGMDLDLGNNVSKDIDPIRPFVVEPLPYSAIETPANLSVARPLQDLAVVPDSSSVSLHSPNGSSTSFPSETSDSQRIYQVDQNFFPGQKIQATVRDIETIDGETLPAFVTEYWAGAAPSIGKLVEGPIIDVPLQNSYDETIEMADIDGDGDLDVVMGAEQNRTRIFVNDDGMFNQDPNLLPSSTDIEVGDIDMDGDPDLILGGSGRNRIMLNEAGAFTNGDTFGSSYTPRGGIAVGDLNGDGMLDVVAAELPSRNTGSGSDRIRIYLNDGTGTFESANQSLAIAMSYELKVLLADVDSDGDLDVIGKSHNHFVIWFNDGSGVIAEDGEVYFDGTSPREFHVGDLDGDHDVDLIGWESTWDNAGGIFTQSTNVQNGVRALADMDGDSDLDIIGWQGEVRLNNGDATFAEAQPSADLYFESLALGDVDGDGDIDSLAITYRQQRSLMAFLNVDTNADVQVSVAGPTDATAPGDAVSYAVSLRNDGTEPMAGVGLSLEIPDGLMEVRWECTSETDVVCGGAGVGEIGDVLDLSPGDSVDYQVSGIVDPLARGVLTLGARATNAAGLTDASPINNFDSHSIRVLPYVIELATTMEPNGLNAIVSLQRPLADVDMTSLLEAGLTLTGSQSGAHEQVDLVDQPEENSIRVSPVANVVAGEVLTVSVPPVATETGVVPAFVGQFRLPVATSSGEFHEAGTLPTRANLYGDIDGDGDADALGRSSVWINNGGLLLEEREPKAGSDTSWRTSGQLVDVDLDGDLDVVDEKYVFLNDGDGYFYRTDSGLGLSRSQLAFGDLDGDGDPDAFAVGRQQNRVLINDGSGVFTANDESLGDSDSIAVALGDLDSDGDLDAVVINRNAANRIWLNSGDGHFSSSVIFGGYNYSDTAEVQIGDVNRDGFLDVFATSGHLLWANDGTGNLIEDYESDVQYNFGGKVAIGDIEGDGDLDVLTASQFEPTFMLRNDGSGKLTAGSPLSFDNTTELDFIDIDGDGDLDAIVGNRLLVNGFDRGDTNADGVVNFADFLVVYANFGQEATGRENGDLDGNGLVNFADFNLLAAGFGRAVLVEEQPVAAAAEPVIESQLAQERDHLQAASAAIDSVFSELESDLE